MLVLALDTTTATLSCALARDGIVEHESGGSAGHGHASRLPLELMQLLERARVSLAEVDLFAVAIGPGSFTGLRIGIATMQGLAFATGKPLVGVSGLDALACVARTAPATTAAPGAPRPARIATWVDAWRGEVYAALYEGDRQVAAPIVTSPLTLLPTLVGTRTLFIGDATETFGERIAAQLGPDAVLARPAHPWLAGAVAVLAAAREERPGPDAIRPLYVRRPDAELARDRRT
jgi:tRNA threonylcarbamoyladenosine biosynthesis protein TsaB